MMCITCTERLLKMVSMLLFELKSVTLDDVYRFAFWSRINLRRGLGFRVEGLGFRV